LQIYENELARVKGENEALQDQLKRALGELKIFQIKYPSPYQNAEFQEETVDKYSIGEGGSAISYSYAAPLFEAYDSSKAECVNPF
jgi:hypothetical protein